MRLYTQLGEERIVRDFEDRLERLEKRGRMDSHPVGEFVVVPAAGGLGAQISFVLRVSRGVSQILLLRNFSLDVGPSTSLRTGSAIAIQTYDARAIGVNKTTTYTDSDPALAGKTAYYWLKVVPISDLDNAILIGPQRFDSNVDTLAPDAIADFDASHESASGGLVKVGIAFKPPANARFGSAKIYIAGYNGVAALVAIAQSQTSPFTFNLVQTGETVTLKGVAVSRTGVESTATAPTKSLTLGTAATVPAKPMGVTATEIATGVQIGFPAGPESSITSYTIYRNTKGAGFATATQIGTVTPSAGIPQSGTYTFLDTAGLTGSYEWYVVATNGAGNSPASDAATTIAFNTSADLPPNPPANTTNQATVDSIDAGSSATIRIYGTGGVGTSWTRATGFGTQTYPAGTITGKSYTTTYYIVYDTSTAAYVAQLNAPDVMPDKYVWVGKLTTVAAGGTGGTSGGGGSGGGSGGRITL